MAFQDNFKEYLSNRQQPENEKMTPKEIQDIQEAINNSKTTADLEKQQREFDRQAAVMQKSFYKTGSSSTDEVESPAKEKPFTPKQWSKPTKSLSSFFKIDKELSGEKMHIAFQDFVPVPGKTLDIVCHSPVFELPVTTNTCLKKCNILEKAKLLIKYYRKIGILRKKLAKESLIGAPLPKLIASSTKGKSPSFEDDNGNIDTFTNNKLPPAEVYVSRSGRHVKRKIYTEEMEVDSDSDYPLSVKKTRADDSDTKIILDTPYAFEENHNEEISASKAKMKKDTPRQRPSLSTNKKFTSRTDVMFDKMAQDQENKKNKEEEREKFEKSLKFDDVEEERWFGGNNSPVKEVDEEENFIRRTVTPPPPSQRIRKGGGRGKKTNTKDLDKIELQLDSPPNSPVLKRYNVGAKSQNKPKPHLKSKSRENDNVAPKFEKTPCPICGKEFLASEIANHASTCGDEDIFNEEPAGTKTSAVKKLFCDLCAKEFTGNTDFEVHVRQCVAARVTDM